MEKVLILVMPAVAVIIVSSDWLISVVLGSQWTGAGPILVFISIAGLFQPIMNTGGWLLVTQGRGRHMLYWSLINAPISVLSIAVGLPWGAVGVAASYSLSRVFITNPLLYWFVGRSGPVRTGDFYRLLAPFTFASLLGILSCILFRHFFVIGNPFFGISVCFSLILAAMILVLSIMPSGRSALRDIRDTLFLLRPVKPNAPLEAR
jgi:PST family polysaccharide transporter